MTEAEFTYLRVFLQGRSGLALSVEKRYLAESRLEPVCRRFGLETLGELVACLRKGRRDEIARAVTEAMTTNETLFFRDRTPFDLLRVFLLPGLLVKRAATRRIRIWCAAASTGQEPYSVAMVLREAGLLLAGWTVEIVATDISTDVLEKARAGLYSHFEVQRGLPIGMLLKYFRRVGDRWEIVPAIQAMVEFKPLNLTERFGHLGEFDLILCRNVLIYFDLPAKATLLRCLAGALRPDGALLLGAAETVIGLSDMFTSHPDHRGLYLPSGAAAEEVALSRPAARR